MVGINSSKAFTDNQSSSVCGRQIRRTHVFSNMENRNYIRLMGHAVDCWVQTEHRTE